MQGYTLRPGDQTRVQLLPTFFPSGASMPSAVLCLWKVLLLFIFFLLIIIYDINRDHEQKYS